MDAYLKHIETEITFSEGNKISLKNSIFHKEGGGQPMDKGKINGIKIISYDGEKFGLEKNPFKVNDKVTLSIDWEYRYALMKAHTAEHILFGSIKKAAPFAEIKKIELSENISSIFISGKLEFDELLKANILANDAISKNLEVTESTVKKDEAENARIKLDRIKGDYARIISIGDYDRAACSGTHVKSTEEIGLVIISRMAKVSMDETKVDFMVGKNAADYACDSSNIVMQIGSMLNEKNEKLIQRIKSLADESITAKNLARKLAKELIESKTFVPVGGKIIESFSGMENQQLIKKISELPKESLNIFFNDDSIIVSGKKAGEAFEGLKEKFSIRGGGRDVMIGKFGFKDYDAIKDFLSKLD